MDWIVLAVGILVGVVVLAMAILAVVRRDDLESSHAMTGDQLFTLGIVFTGAGVALTTSVGPGMLGMVALGLIYMAIGTSRKRKEGRAH